jgi:hypothetical protein
MKKHFLSYIELFGACSTGVGSSGTVAQMPQIPDVGPRIPSRLFSSPPSTPLDGIHDTHPQATTQPGSGGGDRDEPDDVDYMVAFPGVRCVTSMGTLPCTFMVNEEGLPLKKIRLPGSF